jgi:hypothetical protein
MTWVMHNTQTGALLLHDKKILDIPEAQAEAMISPDSIADDLGRESIAGVTRALALHGNSLSVSCWS